VSRTATSNLDEDHDIYHLLGLWCSKIKILLL